jgi:predicted Zn-dependent protease
MVTYLSTHPDTSDRIVDMKRYAQESGWRLQGDITPLVW